MEDHSARFTPANNCKIIYNSDTVYSTQTFRPVSPSPRTPVTSLTPLTPSPQRTRKLETPLHFDGGLFSDIRSTDGKLLSKVTVDHVHSSSRCDVTDAPINRSSCDSRGNRDYVDDIQKTETVTNENVIKIKFTPVPPELNTPRTFTPQFTRPPIEYIKDNFEDLQSYKIVNTMCKENKICSENLNIEDNVNSLFVNDPIRRSHSPLANFLVPEQLNKIDNYLQESLNACIAERDKDRSISRLSGAEGENTHVVTRKEEFKSFEEKQYNIEQSTSSIVSSEIDERSYQSEVPNNDNRRAFAKEESPVHKRTVDEVRSNSVKEKPPGVWRSIYNMPIHYHAAILCFILIVYNLIYQYIKENCHGKK